MRASPHLEPRRRSRWLDKSRLGAVGASPALAAGGGLAPTGGVIVDTVLPIAVLMMLAGAVLFALTRRVKDVVHAE